MNAKSSSASTRFSATAWLMRSICGPNGTQPTKFMAKLIKNKNLVESLMTENGYCYGLCATLTSDAIPVGTNRHKKHTTKLPKRQLSLNSFIGFFVKFQCCAYATVTRQPIRDEHDTRQDQKCNAIAAVSQPPPPLSQQQQQIDQFAGHIADFVFCEQKSQSHILFRNGSQTAVWTSRLNASKMRMHRMGNGGILMKSTWTEWFINERVMNCRPFVLSLVVLTSCRGSHSKTINIENDRFSIIGLSITERWLRSFEPFLVLIRGDRIVGDRQFLCFFLFFFVCFFLRLLRNDRVHGEWSHYTLMWHLPVKSTPMQSSITSTIRHVKFSIDFLAPFFRWNHNRTTLAQQRRMQLMHK